jgi:hypothetical protein
MSTDRIFAGLNRSASPTRFKLAKVVWAAQHRTLSYRAPANHPSREIRIRYTRFLPQLRGNNQNLYFYLFVSNKPSPGAYPTGPGFQEPHKSFIERLEGITGFQDS